MNDRYMKNAVAEIHKLRKEKQQIKSSSVVSVNGIKVTQSNGKKTDKLKDVLVEIEKVIIYRVHSSYSVRHLLRRFSYETNWLGIFFIIYHQSHVTCFFASYNV